MNNDKERRRDIKEIINSRALHVGIVLFLIGLLTYMFVVTHLAEGSVSRIVLKGITEACLIAGIFTPFYEIWIRRKFEEEMASALIKTISADVELLKREFKDLIDNFIKNCLHAKLSNQERATALYRNLIVPNMNRDAFRTSFEYQVFLRENISMPISLDKFGVDKTVYFEIEESLEYKKSLNLREIGELVIGICFNDEQLKHYQHERCIYRIILRIKDNHREKIFKKIIGDKNSINDIFSIEKLKVANQNAKQIKIFKYEEDKGIKIAFENPTKGVSGEVLISIRVRTIRDKNTNFYTAYIFDPTYAPSIVLRYSGTPIRDVCPVIYFTSERQGRNSEIDRGQDYIHIKTPNEWVFPTSGVVFVWKVCDLEGALTHGVEV